MSAPGSLTPVCTFQAVLEDFKKNAHLTMEQTEDFRFNSPSGLRLAIEKIQQEQEGKRRMRYMKRLEPFLHSVEQYGKVVEIFVNTSEILTFVWGPMKWLLLVASNYTEAFDSLLDAYQSIWEELPLLDSFQQVFRDRPYLQTVLSWIYQDTMDFHREAISYFRQKVWKQVFQAAWRGFKMKVDLIKHRMQRHGNLIKTEATLARVDEIHQLNQFAITEFNNIRQAELDRRRFVTIQWLSAPSTHDIHEECLEAGSICTGAGEWLIAKDRFVSWFSPQFCSNPLLWMTGKPGAGKSVLVSRVITKIQQFCHTPSGPSKENVSVAYFYCKHLDPMRNTFLAVARGILTQLLRQNPHLLQHLYEQLSLSGDVSLSAKNLAQDLLTVALNGCKITYIVIDGFDECDRKNRKDIITFFRNAVESLAPADMDTIRCLFVGQDDGIARKDLSGIPTISITPEDNRNDIKSFAEAWHAKIQAKLRLEPSEYDLPRTVTAKSQGMFLFAKLVMENLFEQTSQAKFKAELERFPGGLDEAYGRIVDRVLSTNTDSRKADSLKLLEWLVCAKRPLKWYEIQGALSTDFQSEDGQEVNVQARRCHDNPKDLCASLVEFRNDQTVEFVHPTAKEMTLINRSLSEQMISSVTLGYLGLPVMDRNTETDSIRNAFMRGTFAYLEYAVTCWVLHLEGALEEEPEQDNLAGLTEDVEVFIESRYRNSHTSVHTSKTIASQLAALKSSDAFEKLCQAVIWAHKQCGVHGQASSEEDVLDLSEIVSSVREMMEDFSVLMASDEEMVDTYGPNWFKCPRMNCYYFHQGFKTKSQRQQHLDRHERPYMCIVPECDFSNFGFPTKVLLAHHMSESHAISTDSELDFPEPKKQPPHPPKLQGLYACNLCPKKFTRSHNLKAHLRSHANEKPFLCASCGTGFARTHDLKRHESIHSEEKKCACTGTLKSGQKWGCNATFSRPDKLVDHFKTKTGQQCIKPVLKEEREETKEEREETKEGEQQTSLSDRIAEAVGIESSLLDSPHFFQHFLNEYNFPAALQLNLVEQ